MPDRYQLLAFLSTGAYFAGLALFKSAASSMPTLEGSRPRHLTRTLLTSKRWIAGSAVIGTGAAAQVMALTGLRLLEALPMFLAGLGVLLLLAVVVLGERLTPREWGCAALLAAAAFLLLRIPPGSRAPGDIGTPPPLVVAVALPSLLVPCVMLLASDRARRGAHARPLTGSRWPSTWVC